MSDSLFTLMDAYLSDGDKDSEESESQVEDDASLEESVTSKESDNHVHFVEDRQSLCDTHPVALGINLLKD